MLKNSWVLILSIVLSIIMLYNPSIPLIIALFPIFWLVIPLMFFGLFMGVLLIGMVIIGLMLILEMMFE